MCPVHYEAGEHTNIVFNAKCQSCNDRYLISSGLMSPDIHVPCTFNPFLRNLLICSQPLFIKQWPSLFHGRGQQVIMCTMTTPHFSTIFMCIQCMCQKSSIYSSMHMRLETIWYAVIAFILALRIQTDLNLLNHW